MKEEMTSRQKWDRLHDNGNFPYRLGVVIGTVSQICRCPELSEFVETHDGPNPEEMKQLSSLLSKLANVFYCNDEAV